MHQIMMILCLEILKFGRINDFLVGFSERLNVFDYCGRFIRVKCVCNWYNNGYSADCCGAGMPRSVP